jgi:hypothetical protein
MPEAVLREGLLHGPIISLSWLSHEYRKIVLRVASIVGYPAKMQPVCAS